jgi:hypothetical protein
MNRFHNVRRIAFSYLLLPSLFAYAISTFAQTQTGPSAKSAQSLAG